MARNYAIGFQHPSIWGKIECYRLFQGYRKGGNITGDITNLHHYHTAHFVWNYFT